ncbi:glycosyltransferase [Ensifer sp. MJa1]
MLRKSIKSALNQTYQNIEVCIADDGSTRRDTLDVIEWSRVDPRVKVAIRGENGHISAATNTAFALATGEWTTLLDHDDMLHPEAIEELVNTIAANPDARLIYSDEDKIDSRDRRYAPFFKPDFSIELLSSQNYLNHLTAYRSESIRQVGGWRRGFEGSQDYDLNLRIVETIDPNNIIHIPKVLYHWRATRGSTALSGNEKSYAQEAARRALRDHLRRIGSSAVVEAVPGTTYHKVHYPLPMPLPLVTIVTDTSGGEDDLQRWIEILVRRTSYRPLELVVIRGQEETVPLDLGQHLRSNELQFRVVGKTRGNAASVLNTAVSQCSGEIVCLLESHIKPLRSDWLNEMVATAARAKVGCVGPKILFPGGTVHSAGIVIGVGGTVGHSHAHYGRRSSGYYSRLRLPHDISAVSSLCMVFRKEAFERVGGFSETLSIGILNDVDFCLRLRQANLRHVITPSSEVSLSRYGGHQSTRISHQNAAFDAEYQFLLTKWGRALKRDPFYSPNHRDASADFRLDF